MMSEDKTKSPILEADDEELGATKREGEIEDEDEEEGEGFEAMLMADLDDKAGGAGEANTGDADMDVVPPPPTGLLMSILILALQKLGMVLAVPSVRVTLPKLWIKIFGWIAFFNIDISMYITLPSLPDDVSTLASFGGQVSPATFWHILGRI